MRRIRALVTVLLLALALAGCGGGKLTVDEILTQSAQTMRNAETLSFSIEHEGDPVEVQLSPEMAVSLISLLGAYQAPDSVTATVKIETGGMVTEAEVLWLGEDAYFKLPPFFPTYQPVDLGGFNAGHIFQGEGSLPDIMSSRLIEPDLVSEEDLEGIPTYLIQAQADSTVLADLVGEALPPGTADVILWVDRKSMEVVRVVVSEADGNTWQIDFFDYGEPVEIPTP